MSTPCDRRPSRRLAAAALTAVLAVGGLAACSAGGDGDGGSAAADLARHLPADARDVQVIDLDAGRRAFDLPDDAPLVPKEANVGFSALAARALPVVVESDPGVAKAIDTGAVHASATSYVEDAVTVLRTDQPWDDLVDGLVAAGWKQAGDLVVSNGHAVAHDGDLVAWARSQEAAEAALEPRDGAAQGLAQVVADLDAAYRYAFTLRGPECVSSIAFTQVPGTIGGTLVLGLRDPASWTDPDPDSIWVLSDQEATDDALTATYELGRGDDSEAVGAFRAFTNFETPTDQISCD